MQNINKYKYTTPDNPMELCIIKVQLNPVMIPDMNNPKSIFSDPYFNSSIVDNGINHNMFIM